MKRKSLKPLKQKVQARLKTSTPVTAQLGNELVMLILRWGTIAGALTAIIITMSYTLPSLFRLYSSDSAPFEGKAEHTNDLIIKLQPLAKAITDASDAASKASRAADNASANALVASLKEDQRDLCGLIDRLAAIDMRLQMTPADQFFVSAKSDREREIKMLRQRLTMNGQVPEC